MSIERIGTIKKQKRRESCRDATTGAAYRTEFTSVLLIGEGGELVANPPTQSSIRQAGSSLPAPSASANSQVRQLFNTPFTKKLARG